MSWISRFRHMRIGRLMVSLAALLIVMWSAYLLYPSIRARYLFNQLKTLEIGQSSFEDAQRLARRLGAKPITPTPCDQAYCYWSSEYLSNARLPKWWRGNGVTFAIDFEVKDGVVTNKGAWYASEIINIDSNYTPISFVSVGVREKWIFTRERDRVIVEPPTSKGWGIDYLEKNGKREIVSTKFQVHMTPRSSVEDWRRYTAFNYGCFWKYKGCADARDLLPTADPLEK